MPSAWSGLLHDRGSTALVTSPTDHAVVPSAARATTEPWWWPSTKPERTTSATTTGAGMGTGYEDHR